MKALKEAMFPEDGLWFEVSPSSTPHSHKNEDPLLSYTFQFPAPDIPVKSLVASNTPSSPGNEIPMLQSPTCLPYLGVFQGASLTLLSSTPQAHWSDSQREAPVHHKENCGVDSKNKGKEVGKESSRWDLKEQVENYGSVDCCENDEEQPDKLLSCMVSCDCQT